MGALLPPPTSFVVSGRRILCDWTKLELTTSPPDGGKLHWSSGLTKWGYTPPKETTETFKDWGAEDFIPQAIKGLYHRQLAAPKKEDDEQMENVKKESSKENVKKEASKKKEKTQQGKEEHTKKKSSKKRKLQEISDQEESGSS